MVSNSKDDHPSKTTPITNTSAGTLPKAVQQAIEEAYPHLELLPSSSSSSVNKEGLKQ